MKLLSWAVPTQAEKFFYPSAFYQKTFLKIRFSLNYYNLTGLFEIWIIIVCLVSLFLKSLELKIYIPWINLYILSSLITFHLTMINEFEFFRVETWTLIASMCRQVLPKQFSLHGFIFLLFVSGFLSSNINPCYCSAAY